ncbi:MAG TPA: hypothetical protein VMB81_17815 [Candidatus Sulfotelmatobacter sp.]|nr:hypothetical protein [Candidatus Sulfotelmatobacter sp.]
MSTIFEPAAFPGESRPEWLPSTECAARAEQQLESLHAQLASVRALRCHPSGRAFELPPAAAWSFSIEVCRVVFDAAVARMAKGLGPRLLGHRSPAACPEAWINFERHLDGIIDGELDLARRDELTWTESVVASALESLSCWCRAEAERQLGHAVADRRQAA